MDNARQTATDAVEQYEEFLVSLNALLTYTYGENGGLQRFDDLKGPIEATRDTLARALYDLTVDEVFERGGEQ